MRVFDGDGKELTVKHSEYIFDNSDMFFLLEYNGNLKTALLSEMIKDEFSQTDELVLRLNFTLFTRNSEQSEVIIPEKKRKSKESSAPIDDEGFELDLSMDF